MVEHKLVLASELDSLLVSCDEIWVATAMISDGGFKYIQDRININAKQNYVVGIGLPTSPRVLRKLKDRENNGLFKSRIYTKLGQLFHPKVYLIKNSGKLVAFVGSGNCTRGGFMNNYEVSIMSDEDKLCRSLLNWYKELFNKCEKINDDFLDSYNEQFFQKRLDRIKEDENDINDILTEPSYHILNTNIQAGEEDEQEMLARRKAAAYFKPWKYKINNLKKGDRVFLYSSGRGIIAKGAASGVTIKKEYQKKYKDEEYYQKLTDFKILSKPILASEIKIISGSNIIFRQVMFRIDKETGKKVWKIK